MRAKKNADKSPVLEALFEKAVESKNGISVTSPDVQRLKNRLYTIRANLNKQGINRFNGLQLSISPDYTNVLWLLHAKQLGGRNTNAPLAKRLDENAPD